jgi:multiple sugar transport system ATP-binding protein
LAAYKDKPVTLGVRPEDLHEATAHQDPPTSIFEVTVEVVEPMGHEIYLDVKAAGAGLVARVAPETQVKIGQTMKLAATLEKLHAFDPQTERAIGLD